MRGMSPQMMAQALRRLSTDPEWKKELRKTNAPVSKLGADLSRKEMRGSGDRQLARAAAGVRAAPTSTAAKVRVSGRVPTSTKPMSALAPVYGTRGRTGWFAAPRYRTGANNPPWVGNDWTVGVRGQGPRGVNDALADGTEQILDEFEKAAWATLARAFPDLR
jgi:hypothetical protein